MRSLLPIWFALGLFCCCGTSVLNNDERSWLRSLVELIELDYEDKCDQRALIAWEELEGNGDAFQKKLEFDKAFGAFSKKQTEEIRRLVSPNTATSEDDALMRKVKLLFEPGDILLDTEQWIKLLTFGETAIHTQMFATDYDCGKNANCTWQELRKSISSQQDEEVLSRMKKSWESKLPDLNEYREQIVPLLRNASKENNYKTVEDYWDSLAEYEGGLLKARELWDQIKPLYVKLQKYVSLRLRGADAVGKPLPVHLLRSLSGDDWSNVIESLLPKNPDIYQKLHANLQLKNVGGKEAYRIAEQIVEEMKFGALPTIFWNESNFDGSCPAETVSACKPDQVKVSTCKDVSIGNYLEAHETVMRIKHKEIAALHSNNTFLLREANKFSAIYEAIPGFVSLLAMTPHALDRSGLYPLKRFNYGSNAQHHRLVLQLILALKDLPKLNYYLAADEWRLQLLTAEISKSPQKSWSEFRKDFSLIESSDKDILGEPSVLLNKPLLGNFMGLILKYRIYQSFAEELISDDADLIEHVSEHNNRLIDTMSRGYRLKWPKMVPDLLAKPEHSLEYTALTDYYTILDEYLDKQLDPSQDSFGFNEYEEPPASPLDNEIPHNAIESTKDVEEIELESTHEDINENVIDVGDESVMKHSAETSTVGVLEIKNPVASNEDQKEVDTKEASFSTYWWIGVGVALAIIVILITIVVKKRQNHRKELERQRRDNSQA